MSRPISYTSAVTFNPIEYSDNGFGAPILGAFIYGNYIHDDTKIGRRKIRCPYGIHLECGYIRGG